MGEIQKVLKQKQKNEFQSNQKNKLRKKNDKSGHGRAARSHWYKLSRDVRHTGLKEFVKEEKKVISTDGETEEYSGPSRAQ